MEIAATREIDQLDTEAVVQRQATRARLADFWSLLKSLQTALLLVTAISAYTLTRGLPFDPLEGTLMAIGLLLSISGCTVLNMLLDRDIDGLMERTAARPLPDGRIRPFEAAIFGGLLSLAGLAISFALDLRFGVVVTLGFGFDLLVYTTWLKRRTPLSIIFGGISGGMPVLAGRVLALGRVDMVGILLAGSILLWIPSHILTLAMRYANDYHRAGVPVWPNVYGHRATRLFIAAANLLNTLVLMGCALLLRVHLVALVPLLGMSLGMFALSALQLIAPTDKRNWVLFKVASFYMLVSSLLVTVGCLI
ncbi:MAG: protoheme IX farnesyltransferase [Chloroflexi bacterium]|nr:MAG: protoheme IX farnesyltransferase [Chloroflexota bacterium]